MTKVEIMEMLDKLGVEYNPKAAKPDLKASLDAELKKNVAAKPGGEGAQGEGGLKVADDAKIKVNAGKARITESMSVYKIDAHGREHFVRTYSLEVHGEDYAKLAEQFAGKIKGKAHRDGRKE